MRYVVLKLETTTFFAKSTADPYSDPHLGELISKHQYSTNLDDSKYMNPNLLIIGLITSM